MAVVVAGAAESHELRRDGIQPREPDDRRLPRIERLGEVRRRLHVARDPLLACSRFEEPLVGQTKSLALFDDEECADEVTERLRAQFVGDGEREVVAHAGDVDDELLAEREARPLALPEALRRRPRRQGGDGRLVEPGIDGCLRAQVLLEPASEQFGDPQSTKLQQDGIDDTPGRFVERGQRLRHVWLLGEHTRQRVVIHGASVGRMEPCSPFRVAVPEATLADLRDRLARTRFIDDFPGGDDWTFGVSRSYLRELCEYWRTTFDWRSQEAILNSFDQFELRIDGQPIRFIHQRSSNAEALPLLLVHGWPGSIFEFVKVIGPLSAPIAHGGDEVDAFHVVAPSIPGYGFSGPTVAPGWGPQRIAAAFADVMTTLGYERYGAAGGDWGAIITTQLARSDGGRHLCGLHLTSPHGEPPDDGTEEILSETDRTGLQDWAAHQARRDGRARADQQHTPAHTRSRTERLTGRVGSLAAGQVPLLQRLRR